MNHSHTKKKYMNRTILKIALVGYAALLLLLLTVNLTMLHNNYTDRQETILRRLRDRAAQITECLSATNSFLYNIYVDNPNFRSLSLSPSELEAYNCMYELNNTFLLYQTTHNSFDGYFLFSSQYDNFRYHADGISWEAIDRMKELILASFSTELPMAQYFFYMDETACYGLTVYHQGNAAIACVCTLDQYLDLTEESPDDPPKIYAWFPEQPEGNHPMADNLLTAGRPGLATGSFMETRWNQALYGVAAGDGNIWLICRTTESFFHSVSLLQVFLLLTTLLSVAAVIHLYHSLIRRLVRPMYRLMDVMEGIQGNRISRIPEMDLPFYEMHMMNITLKNMVDEIRNQKIHYYEEKLSRQEAQLQFMQLQLKPHFFLNCLKSLNTMATDAGMSNMQEMILKISDYLRYFLRIDRKTTALREEIAFTGNYIDLQNLLANRQIECHFLMEEDLNDWKVPVLCIQTFVENSVKYVRLPQGEKNLFLQVQINRLKQEDGTELLNIIISDSGQGYPEDLLPGLNRRYYYGTGSVGINNIKQRCDILYGKQTEYSFYNMGGAVSELYIPKTSEGNREEIKEYETLISR